MLSVLMPAHNESGIIAETINETINTLEAVGIEYEIAVVDDGSSDGTLDQALAVAESHPCIKILTYEENKGKGFALSYGFQFTQGDFVLFLDADLDLPPAQIPRFMNSLTENNADVVIGSKRHPLSNVDYPRIRCLWSKGYGMLVKMLFNLNVTDTQVGIKMFKREVLETVLPQVKINRYAFDLAVLLGASERGYKIVEAPIDLNYRFSSHIEAKAIQEMFVDTLSLYRQRRFRINKQK